MKIKSLICWIVILMVGNVCVSLLSCSDDDDDSSRLSGLYYYESGGGSRTAYNFVSSNTVEMYGAMSSDPNAKWLGQRGEAFPLKSGWYYWSGNKHTYSYVIVRDKVIIANEKIMTISGNTLIYDDFGVVLYKWN